MLQMVGLMDRFKDAMDNNDTVRGIISVISTVITIIILTLLTIN